jgi:hypothetical protein
VRGRSNRTFCRGSYLGASIVDPEVGVTEQTLELTVLSREVLRVGQDGEALVESEVCSVRCCRV